MENRSYAGALQGQYTASLASQYAVATNYHAVAHPSLPNYLALTSGSTYGIQDDGYHPLPPGGIGKQLSDAGISWRGYMEGMTSDCLHSPYPYALKHDPFAYYGGGCDNLVSMTNLAADLAGGPPRLLWITPGLCNDGHDCSTATADRWLSMVVPEILASLAWRNNGLLLLTWDEADGSATNQVATLAIAPVVRSHMSAHPYNHYSLLATVEDRLGVGRLGAAKTADAMNDIAGP